MFHSEEEGPEDDLEDRPRALLTRDDRSFLKGEKEFEEEQQQRNARYRIRTRIENGLRDLGFLHGKLEESDIEKIFTKLIEEDHEYLENACGFIFTGVDYVESDLDKFERFLENSIHKAVVLKRSDENSIFTVDVNVDVAPKSANIDKIEERLAKDEATYRDLEYLMKNDETGVVFRSLADKDRIVIRRHFDDEEGEEFTFNELVTLGLSGVRERVGA